MKIDPNEPAMPSTKVFQQPDGTIESESTTGLTIRAEIASRCLAGLIALPTTFKCDGKKCTDVSDYAMLSVRFADALISELNKE